MHSLFHKRLTRSYPRSFFWKSFTAKMNPAALVKKQPSPAGWQIWISNSFPFKAEILKRFFSAIYHKTVIFFGSRTGFCVHLCYFFLNKNVLKQKSGRKQIIRKKKKQKAVETIVIIFDFDSFCSKRMKECPAQKCLQLWHSHPNMTGEFFGTSPPIFVYGRRSIHKRAEYTWHPSISYTWVF